MVSIVHTQSPDRPSDERTTISGLVDALLAAGPAASQGDTRDLYSGLIGSWDAEVVDRLPGGTERRQSAEMHFGWVLEGRAIQDVWIAPARRDRAPVSVSPVEGNRYGTTLRVYDPSIDAWRITWWNPVRGVENRLVGRRAGSQIVQTGSDADGRLIRWVFATLTTEAFHWRGESSEDGGRTWMCDTEFFARRRPTSPLRFDQPVAERRVAWEWIDRAGLETMTLTRDRDGIVAEGTVVAAFDGAPLTVRYRIRHDAAWRFRHAWIEAGSPSPARALEVERNEVGRWTVGGEPRPDLEACEDIDLMASPYTNTPPLARRPLRIGDNCRVRVAWVRIPDLDVRAVEQEYTRLDPDRVDTEPARYRYRNLESGFTGELTADADGLVIRYGPWARLGGW